MEQIIAAVQHENLILRWKAGPMTNAHRKADHAIAEAEARYELLV